VPITIVGKKTATDGVAVEEGDEVVTEIQPVLDLNSNPFVVVLNTINPVAADEMASRCVVVILGGKNP
jgi:hypothetical protein